MFSPTCADITVSGWMLQNCSKNITKSRAQALTDNGNEHAHAMYGQRTTESASFTLGGTYESGNMTLPQIGSTHLTDFTVKYSETAFPSLDVNYDSGAVSSSTFTFPISLPKRTIGVPSTIADIYTAIGTEPVKELTINVSGTHTEDLDGSGAYGTLGEFRDVVVQVTFTGVKGKPAPTMASGWEMPNSSEGDSNTAIPTGSIIYEKHFPFGNDSDADGYVAQSPSV